MVALLEILTLMIFPNHAHVMASMAAFVEDDEEEDDVDCNNLMKGKRLCV